MRLGRGPRRVGANRGGLRVAPAEDLRREARRRQRRARGVAQPALGISRGGDAAGRAPGCRRAAGVPGRRSRAAEALALFTSDAAFAAFEEESRGRIEAGYRGGPDDPRARPHDRARPGDPGDSRLDDRRQRPDRARRDPGAMKRVSAAPRRYPSCRWGSRPPAAVPEGRVCRPSNPPGRMKPPRGREWSKHRSWRAACGIRACSRRCERCPGTSSSTPAQRAQAYEDHPLPIGRRPDDLAALHRGPDDRALARSQPKRACSRSGRARATRRRPRGDRRRTSTRSRSCRRWRARRAQRLERARLRRT